MNKDQKLEEIRKACIAANPAILELGFGCEFEEVMEEGKVESFIFLSESRVGGWNVWSKERDDMLHDDFGNPEILGRPIRLADVLLAINKKLYNAFTIDPTGCMRIPGMKRYTKETIYWNLLKDDLRDQSEETISFIHSLLTGK